MGRCSWFGTALLAAFSVGLQTFASWLASLIIMPVGRESVKRLRQVQESALVKKYVPDVAANLEPAVRMLGRAAQRLDFARQALLELGQLRLNSSEALVLHTPDGVQLDGVLLGGAGLRSMVAAKNATTAEDDKAGCRGVIIYCGGNGEHFELRPDLVTELAVPRKFALLLLNYRGIGRSGVESQERCSRNGGVLDVVTALAFLTCSLGVPSNRIVLIGHSIGGGYATEAATHFPGLLLLSDRSFSSLSTVALYHVAPPLVEGATSVAPWASVARAAFRFLLRYIACWELDSVSHWATLPRNTKMIVHSQDDEVIKPPAQMLSGLMTGPVQPHGLGCIIAMDRRSRARGEDAHNCTWTAGEMARIDAVITKFLKGHPLGDTA